MKIPIPNLLVLSGEGQNTGKTTLGCLIISHFVNSGVIGIKVTPHFHKLEYPLPLHYKQQDISVFREVRTDTQKDSSRYMRAGASEVFLILAKGDLSTGLSDVIRKIIPSNVPVICESGSIIKQIEPAIHLLLTSESPSNKLIESVSAKRVSFDGQHFDFDVKDLTWDGESWGIIK